MEKETTMKYVLSANALLLMLGTFFETVQTPYKHVAMSILFITWLSISGWYMYQFTKAEPIE